MEWIVFAKSDSATFSAFGIDYARRRKKVVAADYHAYGLKMASVATVFREADDPMHVAQKCAAVLGL
jgi:hypothetical protein